MSDPTDIHSYSTVEEVEAALEDEDIADDLYEDMESKIIEAAEEVNLKNDSDDLEDILENFFNYEFVDAVRESVSEDIDHIPDEIIVKKLKPYWKDVNNNKIVHPTFSLSHDTYKTSKNFATIPNSSMFYIDPSEHIDFLELIPAEYEAELAKEFWRNIPAKKKIKAETFQPQEIEGEDTFIDVYYSQTKLDEMVEDMNIEFFEQEAENPEIIDIFLRRLGESRKDKEIRKLITENNLTKEEQLDVIRLFFDSSRDFNELIVRVAEFVKNKNKIIEPIISVPKEILRHMGISSGTLYENAPIHIMPLEPVDLFTEGTLQRLCISDPKMGYYQELMNNTIEMWSVRTKDNKRLFTIELDTQYKNIDEKKIYSDRSKAEFKGQNVVQIKGKANRLPGFNGKVDIDEWPEIKKPDEVLFFFHLFEDMGFDLSQCSDISYQLERLNLRYRY